MIFSIPAVKGNEFGSGFQAARMKGSQHNDLILSMDGKTETNHAGGINGGISNGNDLIFRVAIKPTSSISKEQKTLNIKTGKIDTLKVEGRHDLCVALRAPIVVEAATAIVLADAMMQEQKIKKGT
jgi:chorismate synthase